MHHLSSPFPPLTTSHKRSPRPASDTSTSPPSSRTASPPSSPTSSHRHHSQPYSHSHNHNHPNHLSNLFHPHSNSNHNHTHNHNQPTSNPKDESRQPTHPATSTPDSPAQCGISSILPCAVLRGRSSMMLLRRRPSAVDMALTEERSRCDGDAIERQGLDLMEPRPVDMNANMNVNGGSIAERASLGASGEGRAGVQQPRFVMGGIFEVMEGRA